MDIRGVHLLLDSNFTWRLLMTIPQTGFYNTSYRLNQLINLLDGAYNEESEERVNIYDICKSIEIEVTEFNERMELLEDKMNLIIKLLSKGG